MEHHEYFWLNEERKNRADREEFEKRLQGLVEIRGVEKGFWSVPAATAVRPVVDLTWDYALSITFPGVPEHDAYQIHPFHISS